MHSLSDAVRRPDWVARGGGGGLSITADMSPPPPIHPPSRGPETLPAARHPHQEDFSTSRHLLAI